jgi:probable phosphoglycerate mutase
MTRIYLIRHGETVWNREGRLQGHLDSPLTLNGIRQAEAYGRKLAEISAGEALSLHASPLGRTRQTAAIICEIAGLPYNEIRVDARLKEISLGEHDGYPGWEQLDRDFPELAARRKADPWNYQHPGGESSELVRRRVRPFLEELRQQGGVHLIVAHGVLNKVMRGVYRGLSEEECFALDRPQDGFYVLEDGRERFVSSLG